MPSMNYFISSYSTLLEIDILIFLIVVGNSKFSVEGTSLWSEVSQSVKLLSRIRLFAIP